MRIKRMGNTDAGEERREMGMEILKRGGLIGLTLWIAAALFISLEADNIGQQALPWLALLLPIYLGAGCLLTLLGQKKKPIGLLSGIWGMAVPGAVLLYVAALLPQWVSQLLGVNIVTLVIFFGADYWYISRMAKKLNMGRKGFSLCVSLREKPLSKEDFLGQFEEYCRKEGILLEYEVKDVPAIVRMDGLRCSVKLDSTPGFGGAEYVMKITEL